ncbi:hypothetical protein KI688_004496 [Linnemannia hyalina]|uniref:Uncharacterized protein n=1 Tax=Linnemannia hyalina TaxID=64524 RepID=A0A9P8BQ58_9FUNG|nr:hypothetical protein KI688_004496 [Linnemannia hyalina]
MEFSSPSAAFSPFSPETMMTDFQTLTHRLAIEEGQQRQIDSFQDNSNFIDQLAKEDNMAAAVFAKTQMSFVADTPVAAGQSPLLSPPTTSSSSSSSSTSTPAASRPSADTPKTALVQPPFTSMIISSAPNGTTPTATTTTITTLSKKPPATPGGTKKPPSKTTTTKTSNKPTIQSCPSPKVQIRLDRFLVSRKPSLASTTKLAVNSETNTPEKSILKHCTAGSNTSSQSPASATPKAVKSSATSSTTTPKPKPKSRVRVSVRTKPAPTPPSAKTTKPTEPTTPSPVEKRTITLHKTSRTPPSPPKPRLKANFFFGLLPPPTVTTANSKAGETLRRAGDPNTSTSRSTGKKPKNAPKAGPDASTATPPADTNVATPKLTKVKELEPDSNDAASTGSTTATGKDVSPTEVTRRVVKSKSILPKLKSTIASVVKAGTDKTVVPAVSKSMTTPPLVTKKTSMPVEISSRVIKIEPSVPKSKFRPTTATPTSTTTPAPKVMATSETTSLKAVSKPTKVPCTSKNTTTVTAVSKTKTHPPPVAKSVVAPAARSKKLSDTVPPYSTKASATTTIVSVVPKTRATPKDASTAPKLSPKDSTFLKNLKSSSTSTITTITSVSNDSTTVPKLSKNVTISTSAPKNNKGKVRDKDSLRTSSGATTATKPAAQPRSTPQPRPKRVLELMLQSDHDPPTTSLHINENDPSYYIRSSEQNPSSFNNLLPKNDDIASSSNPRPRKRQRLADIITAESMAGRNHGMFGQTAFEQALDAMSFKYPTPALVPGPVNSEIASVPEATTGRQYLNDARR